MNSMKLRCLNAALCAVLTVGLGAPSLVMADDGQGAMVQDQTAQSELAVMAQYDLHDVDLSSMTKKTDGKVDDLAGAVVWLGKKIGHGTKVVAKFTYKHIISPIDHDALAILKAAVHGTVYVTIQVVSGVVTVTRVVVKGAEYAYKDAIAPLIVNPIIQAGKLALVDGLYGMILYPTEQFLVGTYNQDVVTGAEDFGKAEVKGTEKLVKDTASDIQTDAQAYYKIVIYPVFKDLVKPVLTVATDAVIDTEKTVGWLVCEYVNSWKTDPSTCKVVYAAQYQPDAQDSNVQN